jgi:D-alanyl-D-alanine carboxypeptidase (penicillin-binding protein 5/6)
LRKGESDQLTTRLTVAENVEAPVEQNQILGQLEVYVGEELRDSIPLVCAQSVPRLTVSDIFFQMLHRLLPVG